MNSVTTLMTSHNIEGQFTKHQPDAVLMTASPSHAVTTLKADVDVYSMGVF
jgi:hypothetical protein